MEILRIVAQRPDGIWVNKRNGGKRATSVHQSRSDAEKEATSMLARQGGDLMVYASDGSIVQRLRVRPGGGTIDLTGRHPDIIRFSGILPRDINLHEEYIDALREKRGAGRY